MQTMQIRYAWKYIKKLQVHNHIYISTYNKKVVNKYGKNILCGKMSKWNRICYLVLLILIFLHYCFSDEVHGVWFPCKMANQHQTQVVEATWQVVNKNIFVLGWQLHEQGLRYILDRLIYYINQYSLCHVYDPWITQFNNSRLACAWVLNHTYIVAIYPLTVNLWIQKKIYF